MTGPLLVLTLRLTVPFTILRRRLQGLIASLLADAFDVVLLGLMGRGGFTDYAATDKLLDTYYLTFAAIVSVRWHNPWAKYASLGLYVYRLVGVVLFEPTGERVLLLYFPNLFENFVLFYLLASRLWPRFQLASVGKLAIVLALPLVPKLPQEYMLHYQQFGSAHWVNSNLLHGALSADR